MKLRNALLALTGCLIAVGTAGHVHAQALPPRGETVETRARPEIDPLGVRVRSFFFFPKLTVEEEYNDNIFADENGREDDFITRIAPELSIVSDWSRHAFSFSTGAESGFHRDNQNEDYTDWFVRTAGVIDVSSDIVLDLDASYEFLHEERSSPDDVGGRNPTEIDVYQGGFAYNHDLGMFDGLVTGTFTRLDYEDEGDINNDDRDRNIYVGAVRLSYEILPPDYDVFVELGGNQRVYDNTPDDSDFDRDSSGWNASTGVSLDLGGLLFGEASVGYLDQSFDNDKELDSVSGLRYGLNLDWNVTPLTTVQFFGDRTVTETTTTDASGNAASAILQSNVGFAVDHELLRTLVLSTEFNYLNSDFEGISREDEVFDFELGARYFLNRNIYANVVYGLTRRLSDDDGNGAPGTNDFLENSFRIFIEAQL